MRPGMSTPTAAPMIKITLMALRPRPTHASRVPGGARRSVGPRPWAHRPTAAKMLDRWNIAVPKVVTPAGVEAMPAAECHAGSPVDDGAGVVGVDPDQVRW